MPKSNTARTSNTAQAPSILKVSTLQPRPYVGGPTPPEPLTTATPVTHLLFADVLIVQAGIAQSTAITAARTLQIMASELLSLGVDEPDEYEVRGYQALRTAAMFFSEVSSALLCSLAKAQVDQCGPRNGASLAFAGATP